MSTIPSLPVEWEAALHDPGDPKWATRFYQDVEALYASAGADVFPDSSVVFRAFELTHPDLVRVIVVGLDPYRLRDPSRPTRGIADGLAFSARGYKPPASLQAMLYNLWQCGEVASPPTDADLSPWAANQGVLLLNLSLTVEWGAKAADRRRHQRVYQELLERVASFATRSRPAPIAFLLLGKEASQIGKLVGNPLTGQVVVARHPSRSWWPNAGPIEFPFTAVNSFLGADRRVDWRL